MHHVLDNLFYFEVQGFFLEFESDFLFDEIVDAAMIGIVLFFIAISSQMTIFLQFLKLLVELKGFE